MTARTYLYARVSTTDQTTDNQMLEVKTAGYSIPDYRVFSETVSGSKPVAERPVLLDVIKRLEPNDTLLVTKLDRQAGSH